MKLFSLQTQTNGTLSQMLSRLIGTKQRFSGSFLSHWKCISLYLFSCICQFPQSVTRRFPRHLGFSMYSGAVM